MQGLSRKSLAITALLVGINLVGLARIHYDLTQPPRATARVLSASLAPDANNPDRIQVAFDRDMVPEAEIGRSEKQALFRLDPVCPGQWVWSGRDALEYLLDKPLPQGCRVKMSATPYLKRVTGRTLEGTAKVEPGFGLLDTNVKGPDLEEVTSVNLHFSQALGSK